MTKEKDAQFFEVFVELYGMSNLKNGNEKQMLEDEQQRGDGLI